MKAVSFKHLIPGLIATTLASSHTWAMEKEEATKNAHEQTLTTLTSPLFKLNIGWTPLTSDDTVANLSTLRLTTLPPEMGKLTALTRLDLCNNQLTDLPAGFGSLTALTVLILNENKISIFPPEICSLTALTCLALFSNQLTSLPSEIGNLTALEGLYLGRNNLTTLPAEIANLTALTELNLIKNPLTGKECKWARFVTGDDLAELQLFYAKKNLKLIFNRDDYLWG